MRSTATCAALVLLAGAAAAKLPSPTDEAKAKAAETAAKTAWSDKVAGYQLCKTTDRIAADYLAASKKAGKEAHPAPTPPCTDPGPFVYAPPEARPIEAAGAHSPPQTATAPPNTTTAPAPPAPKR